MDQKIDPLRVFDEVFGKSGITREHDRTTLVVDAVAKCGFHGKVIHFKGGDLDSVFF